MPSDSPVDALTLHNHLPSTPNSSENTRSHPLKKHVPTPLNMSLPRSCSSLPLFLSCSSFSSCCRPPCPADYRSLLFLLVSAASCSFLSCPPSTARCLSGKFKHLMSGFHVSCHDDRCRFAIKQFQSASRCQTLIIHSHCALSFSLYRK